MLDRLGNPYFRDPATGAMTSRVTYTRDANGRFRPWNGEGPPALPDSINPSRTELSTPVWEDPLVIDDSNYPPGGIIEFRFFKNVTDPTVPCVWNNTEKPVIVQNCWVHHVGEGVSSRTWENGAFVYRYGVNLTVRNCAFFGEQPDGALTQESFKTRGRAVRTATFKNLVVENNYMDGTGGNIAAGYVGNNTWDNRFSFSDNYLTGTSGRYTFALDGDPEYPQYGRRSARMTNMIQLMSSSTSVPIKYGRIENNYFYSRPGCRIEDILSLYGAGGFSEEFRFIVRNNFLRGAHAWPLNSVKGDVVNGVWKVEWQDWSGGAGTRFEPTWDQTGSAMMIEFDHVNHKVPCFVDIIDNIAVDTSNNGFCAYAGKGHRYKGNITLSTGIYQNCLPEESSYEGTIFGYGYYGYDSYNRYNLTSDEYALPEYGTGSEQNYSAFTRGNVTLSGQVWAAANPNVAEYIQPYLSFSSTNKPVPTDENNLDNLWWVRQAGKRVIGMRSDLAVAA